MYKTAIIINTIEALSVVFAIFLLLVVRRGRKKRLMTRKTAIGVYIFCLFLMLVPFLISTLVTYIMTR